MSDNPITPQGWQPIETAPKDGTQILVWEAGDVSVVAWERIKNCNGWQCFGDGRRAVEYMSDFGTDYLEAGWPTHWMPLPPAPGEIA